MKPQMLLILTPEEFDTKLELAVEKALRKLQDPDELIDREKAAKILGVSTYTIRRMEKRGDLSPVSPFGKPRYRRDHVTALLLGKSL